ADEFLPSWSPDGTSIVFVSNRDGNPEIYRMQADGSGETRLTNDKSFDSGPDWSPDGTKIVFFSDRTGNSDLYVMNADGSGVTRLTRDRAFFDVDPAWSPDGRKIAYASANHDDQGGFRALLHERRRERPNGAHARQRQRAGSEVVAERNRAPVLERPRPQ